MPAGRSYHGVDVSPWNEGRVYGGSLGVCCRCCRCDEAAWVVVVGVPLRPLEIAARSLDTRSALK